MADEAILNDGKVWAERTAEEKRAALAAWHANIGHWFLRNLRANVEAEQRGEKPLGIA